MTNHNIGKSAYLLLVFVIIVLTTLGIISNVVVQKNGLQHNAHANILNYHKQFDLHIEEETQMLKSFLKLLSEKEGLHTAFINSDKERLFKSTEKIYNNLNKNNDITHLYFIKNNGEVLLRAHDFKRDGDIINRYTFLNAKKKEKTFSGIEFGMKKNYTLRVVYPWIIKGKLIGYIEIGKEIDKILDTLSQQLGVEIAIAVEKSQYKGSAEFIQNRLKNLMQTKTQYIVYSTLPKSEKLISLFEEHKQNQWIDIENSNYISYVKSLEDISKQKLGETLFLVDITLEYQELKTSLYFYISIMIVGTLLMLWLGYNIIRKKQKELNLALEKMDLAIRYKSGLLSLFDHGDSVLFRWNNDDNWSIDYVSSNVANLLGYEKEVFLNSKVAYSECIHKEDFENVMVEVQEGSKSKDNFFKHAPYRIITKDKKVKWVFDYTVIIRDKDENITHYLGYIIDITEQENILKNLEKFIETQNNIVILTDGKHITFANQQFLNFFGCENLAEFKKKSDCICEYFVENDRFFHLGKINENQNWIEELQKLPDSQKVVALTGLDLVGHAFSVHVNEFEDTLLIVSFTDISETILNQIELENKNVHDKLTGAFNREYFEQNYKRLIRESLVEKSLFALALLDIDFFKDVNDNYGHDVGDIVLIEYVKIVQECSRNSDVLVRWGGEEFILVLKIKKQHHLEKILENIRKTLETHSFSIIGTKTSSIGGTVYKDNENIEKTIKRADEAVYEAKENGRNRVVVKL